MRGYRFIHHCLIFQPQPELEIILQWRKIQVQQHLSPMVLSAGFLPRDESTFDGAGGRHPVPAHVATQGLADGELEAADEALMHFQNAGGILDAGFGGGLQAPLLVARSVAAERLEGREPPVARLALEHPPRRRLRLRREAVLHEATAPVRDGAGVALREKHPGVCHLDALNLPSSSSKSISLHVT